MKTEPNKAMQPIPVAVTLRAIARVAPSTSMADLRRSPEISMEAPPIEDASKVIDAFGYFPTFHDGEITDLHLFRNSTPNSDYPTVSLVFTLHGWEMTSEVTLEGFYRLTKHHLLRFRFDHIDAVDLRFFNHQNVISELTIERIDPPTDHALIRVEFGSCFGLEGGFRAITGKIEEIIPCDADGIPQNKGEQVGGGNRLKPVPHL